MKKLLALTTTLSLSAGVFGVAGAAQAFSGFTVGSKLNIATTLQVNSQISQAQWNEVSMTVPGGIGPYSLTEINGITDVLNGGNEELAAFYAGGDPAKLPGDVIFATTVPNGNFAVNAANRILNAQLPPNPPYPSGPLIPNPQAGNVIDAEPGDLGLFVSTGGNQGTWAGVAPNIQGQMRNFDGFYSPNQLTNQNAFMYFKDTATNDEFLFSLVDWTFTGLPSATLLGTGKVIHLGTGQIADVRYDATSQELIAQLPVGGGNPFNITEASSFSMSITVQSVPEPASVMGLMAAVTLGFLTIKKNKA